MTTNPADDLNEATLRKERTESSFPVRPVTEFLYGGKELLETYERAASIIGNDPVFSRRSSYFQSRPEAYKNALHKAQRFKEIIHEQNLDEETANLMRLYVGEQMPINLHFVMFLPTIRGQATEEQKRRWLPDAEAMRIIGTYAQTEIGHGSFVRGLETTATYDPSAQEFVLHSPTLTAGKWWPGGLGRTSTHAVVMARLVTLGKDHGVHAFMVQLRSLDTHLPLPGIELLDIGPKCGYSTIDNGHLRLNAVRIPRDNMLMRFATVSPDGVYHKPPHAKLAYGTMVYVRAHMVLDAARALGAAATIATRYSAVRRQFPAPGSGPARGETPVLDYPAQQLKLAPLVAAAYAFFVAGNDMRELYHSLQRDLAAGDFSSLPDVHALCSGLKVTCSDIAANGIETCRRACGGHGYSMFAGINDLLQDYKAAVSYEGENTVLIQQTARYLIKSAAAIAAGAAPADLAPGARYLADAGTDAAPNAVEPWLLPATGIAALAARARAAVRDAATALQKSTSGGSSPAAAWASEQVYLVRAGEAHAELCVARSLAGAVGTAPAAAREVFARLSAVFNLTLLDRHPAATAAAGLAVPGIAAAREAAMGRLLAELRPHMVPLVDALNFPDHFLNSALGRYDGRVYEAMLDWAREGTLNQSEVAPGIREHLQPMMRATGSLRAKL